MILLRMPFPATEQVYRKGSSIACSSLTAAPESDGSCWEGWRAKKEDGALWAMAALAALGECEAIVDAQGGMHMVLMRLNSGYLDAQRQQL
jgi:hypothetical protein